MDTPGHHDDTRRSYDAVADHYVASLRDELDGKPLDRALLGMLVEEAGAGSPVADLGCGPGHVAAWLAGRGAAAVGIDLSAGMVAVGHREFPGVEFRQGDLLRLPAAGEEFGAAVALYSIIHLEPAELPGAFAEMRRVLRPGGLVLVAFHAGTEVRHRDQWWDRKIDLDFRFFVPEHIARVMDGAGLPVEARLERVNYPHEVETRRAYLLARRPGRSGT